MVDSKVECSRANRSGQPMARFEGNTDTEVESPVKGAGEDRFRGAAWSNMRVTDLQDKAEKVYSTFIRDIIGKSALIERGTLAMNLISL